MSEDTVKGGASAPVAQRLAVGVPQFFVDLARNASGRNHSRKLVRRLFDGSEGMNPWPWSMTFQPSVASCSRNGFSTWRYSDNCCGLLGPICGRKHDGNAAGQQILH
jgi:hypothetical protein